MKAKHFLRTMVLAALAALVPLSLPAGQKPLITYYMPWYAARPYSKNWGLHWTMQYFNPELLNAAGQRRIASWYYPLIGPYDSADPAVLEYHVLLMKLAGIDGIAVDWYGYDNYSDHVLVDKRTAALFNYASRAGLTFCLCYEDQIIPQEISAGYLTATGAVAHVQQTMLYVQTNYFALPQYMRWDQKPVLLNFGPQYFKVNPPWVEIFSVLDATNRPAFFTEDARLPVGAGAFNWPPMWLSQAPGTSGVLSTAALNRYLADFEKGGSGWPAYISSAFPRFHDIYQQAGIRDYWGYLGDRNGETLKETLTRALTNNSVMAQIVTWNDYGDGTVVEPTVEFGYRDLQIIQDCRRRYLDPQFSYNTNDLALAFRFYNLRQQYATNSSVAPQLDSIFTNIVTGDLPLAGKRLTAIEALSPTNTLSKPGP